MDENNPIEGLDPSQSAFEPLMDQTMPEGVQGMRTTTTTTMYISGSPFRRTHRSYGSKKPSIVDESALSLEPKSEEEKKAAKESALEYQKELPEPEEKEFNLRQDRLNAEEEQSNYFPSQDLTIPRSKSSLFDATKGRINVAELEYQESLNKFEIESQEGQDISDVQRMFNLEGIDSPETDEAVKDGYITYKELKEFRARKKKFDEDINKVIREGKIANLSLYNSPSNL